MTDRLDLHRVNRLLMTRMVGRPLIWFDSIPSTNRYLVALSRQGEATYGHVVGAEMQTHGTGRRGRDWHSPPGKGLWFSVLLEGTKPQLLSLGAGVAVVSAVKTILGLPLSLRWPNDVYAGPLKIGGILAHAALPGSRVVVGIGLNVNQGEEDFPSPLRGRATSLYRLVGRPVDREALFAVLLREIEAMDLRCREGGWEAILMQYVQYSDLIDREIRLRMAEGIITGRVVGFHARGDLLIETEGTRRRVTEGEVVRVLDASGD